MDQLVQTIERELLYQIIFSLQNNETSIENAKNLAKDFLAQLPMQSEDEAYQKLSKLGEKYGEAREVFLKHGVPLEEKKTQQKIAELKENFATTLEKGDQ